MRTLVTGATGFLGRQLVRALLERDPGRRLLALIRAPDDESAAGRRRRLVQDLPPALGKRVEVVRGDVAVPRLGLADAAYGTVVREVERVVHVAATVRFDETLTEARRTNVGGTEGVLALCRAIRDRGRSGRLDYVGTAYVAGDRTDVAREDELDVGQMFRNSYERSKFEAEQRCRAAQAELPVVIHRPSIIVGDSRTGRTTAYNTIYWPMKHLVRFYLSNRVLLRVVPLPFRPDCPVDVVPVDWVADAVTTLFHRPDAAGQCFHLAAGPSAPTVEQLVNIACDHFGVRRLGYLRPGGPARRLARAARPLLLRAAPRVVRTGGLFLPYGQRNPRFDLQNASAAGLVAPVVEEYFRRLLSYACGTDFGRRREAGASASG